LPDPVFRWRLSRAGRACAWWRDPPSEVSPGDRYVVPSLVPLVRTFIRAAGALHTASGLTPAPLEDYLASQLRRCEGYWLLGQYATVSNLLRGILASLNREYYQRDRAQAAISVSMLLESVGRYGQALRIVTAAGKTADAHGWPEVGSRAHEIAAGLIFKTGHPRLSLHMKPRPELCALDPHLHISGEHRAARSLCALGEHETAISILRETDASLASAGRTTTQSLTTLLHLADVYHHLGALASEEETCAEAAHMIETLFPDSRRGKAYLWWLTARRMMAEGQAARSLQHARAGLMSAVALGDSILAARCLMIVAGEPGEAERIRLLCGIR